MVTSFGCCWYSGGGGGGGGGVGQSPDYWSSCNVQGKMAVRGMEGCSGIVMDDVCEDGLRNLGGSLFLMLLRAGILVGEMVVVEVGVISFSEKRCGFCF